MDRVMDSGDVSVSDSETTVRCGHPIHHTPNAESSLFSVFAVSLFSTKHIHNIHLRLGIYILYISNHYSRDTRAMYYSIMIDPRGKTWYGLESPQQLTQRESHANNARLQRGKGERSRLGH
jgi:hypothetical protein